VLRFLVLLLVLLNAGYYAWSHEMLRAYGFAPASQAEPDRLKQQIRPELLIILSAEQARQAEATPPAPVAQTAATCLQAGLFDDIQAALLRQNAQTTLPAGVWSLEEISEPARWIVYMGKYPDAPTLARKRVELLALNVRLEPIENPALANGLSLGGFDSQARATAELAVLSKRGVHTAQVLQERAETHASMFRISPVDDALRARIDALRPALAGKTLRPCS
jgi:hypothetical protein